jgi:hypothetical protein
MEACSASRRTSLPEVLKVVPISPVPSISSCWYSVWLTCARSARRKPSMFLTSPEKPTWSRFILIVTSGSATAP